MSSEPAGRTAVAGTAAATPLQVSRVDPDALGRSREIVAGLSSVLVAYSGGVDSSLLLKLALDELGPDRAVAALAVSAAFAEADQDEARALASSLGARLVEVRTAELELDAYRANGPDRCFHCREELFETLEPVRARLGLAHLAYGAMADDLDDHRPGHGSAVRRGVRFPLLEGGLGKAQIRAAARDLGLPNWDRPADACLSSRVPAGTEVTAAVLGQVERAEAGVRALGFAQVRVRHHGQVARIEVDPDEIARLIELRAEVAEAVRAAGYTFAAADLEGYQTGGLNRAWRPGAGRPERRA